MYACQFVKTRVVRLAVLDLPWPGSSGSGSVAPTTCAGAYEWASWVFVRLGAPKPRGPWVRVGGEGAAGGGLSTARVSTHILMCPCCDDCVGWTYKVGNYCYCYCYMVQDLA